MKRVTIADVAARAGVSKSTVSHALSGKRTISPATRARIHAVIEEFGYRPNALAQRLAVGGHGRTLGLFFRLFRPVITELETRFIVGAANVANAADYTFLVLTHWEDNREPFERAVDSALVDGFVLMQVQLHDPRVALLRRNHYPFVLIGRCADNTGISYIDSDVDFGMKLCVDHLASLGHRSVAFLYLDDPDFGFSVRAREEFLKHCQRHGLTATVLACKATAEGGEGAAQQLFTAIERPTAIIAWNEAVAEGVARSASGHGLRVPHDCSLLCFTSPRGEIHINSGEVIQATYMNVPAEQLASLATQTLIELLEKDSGEVRQVLYKPTLVIGQSTAPGLANHLYTKL